MRVVLASASPARLATLRAAGVRPDVVVSGVDEDAITADSTEELVVALAVAKARSVLERPEAAGADLVIGCDSLLDLDGQAVGKPGDADTARERWRSMRGRSGVLVTGHCLIVPVSGAERASAATTRVHFADLGDAEIDAYVATGEPLAVAGAFTVDGLGGPFVTRIEGDHHNVVGISLPLVRRMAGELGIGWPDLWAADDS